MNHTTSPLARLRRHVSGAIARGEAEAISGINLVDNQLFVGNRCYVIEVDCGLWTAYYRAVNPTTGKPWQGVRRDRRLAGTVTHTAKIDGLCGEMAVSGYPTRDALIEAIVNLHR